MYYSPLRDRTSKTEKTLMLAIQRMKDQYAGIGKNGYLAKVTQQALKKSIMEKEAEKIKQTNLLHSNSMYPSQRRMTLSEMREESKKVRKSTLRQNNYITNPYNDILYTSDSSNSSEDERETEEKEEKKRNLYFDIEAYKNPYTLVTDKQLIKMHKKKEIRKSVHKEIKKVEKMFPVALVSKKNYFNQNRNQSLQEMKGQIISNYKSLSKYNQDISGIINKSNSKDIKNFSVAEIKTEDDSMISDESDQPYKQLPEKAIIFKILDKHAKAVADKKKRQHYMQKQGFLKGLFNDHSLHWEMRNNSTRAQNYVGVRVLKNTYDDVPRTGGNSYIPQSPKRKQYSLLQGSKSTNQLLPSIEHQEDNKSPRLSQRRQKSIELFQSINKKANLVIDNCISAREDIHKDKKRFFTKQQKLQEYINVKKSQEQRIYTQKENLKDADNYAKLMGNNKLALKRKIFEAALQEFKDEEYMEHRNNEIAKFLNEDYQSKKLF